MFYLYILSIFIYWYNLGQQSVLHWYYIEIPYFYYQIMLIIG